AEDVVVEQSLPVLAQHRSLPPRGLDLPTCDRIQRPVPRAADEGGRAVGVQGDLDRRRWGKQACHAKRSAGSGEERRWGRGLRTTSWPQRSCRRSNAASTSSWL